jgi:hypothetical protein
MDAVGFTEEEYAGHSARYSSIVKQIDDWMDPATGVLDKDVAELAGLLFALQHGIFRSALEIGVLVILRSVLEIGVYLSSSVPATDTQLCFLSLAGTPTSLCSTAGRSCSCTSARIC